LKSVDAGKDRVGGLGNVAENVHRKGREALRLPEKAGKPDRAKGLKRFVLVHAVLKHTVACNVQGINRTGGKHWEFAGFKKRRWPSLGQILCVTVY
jgi:hypothetical protein